MIIDVQQYLEIRGRANKVDSFKSRIHQAKDIDTAFKICNDYFPNYIVFFQRNQLNKKNESNNTVIKPSAKELYFNDSDLEQLSLDVRLYLMNYNKSDELESFDQKITLAESLFEAFTVCGHIIPII